MESLESFDVVIVGAGKYQIVPFTGIETYTDFSRMVRAGGSDDVFTPRATNQFAHHR